MFKIIRSDRPDIEISLPPLR